MDYSEETKDFYASNYTDSHSKDVDTLEKQHVIDFFNSYYFITKEKLTLLFPPEFVKAEYMSRNCIIIKKYYSQYSNKNDESYYKFTYGYYSGYLFLTSYKNNIPVYKNNIRVDELDVYLNYW